MDTEGSNNSSSNVQTSIVTSTQTVITHNSTIGTTPPSAAPWTSHDGSGAAVTVITIIIVLVVAAAFSVFTYRYLKKKGHLSKLSLLKLKMRSQKSSISSSRRALEDQEEVETTDRARTPLEIAEDMFTIDDFEHTAGPHEGREEYFYDEVFSQSQFEDETTNNVLRQLYSDRGMQPEEEMQDLDFETLGTKLDSLTQFSGRKNSV